MIKDAEKIREVSRNQLIRGAHPYKTICEVFRLIYDEIHDMPDNKKITELLVDGIIMGSKMDRRLKYYQNKYEDGTGGRGKDIPRLWNFTKRRDKRRARVI